MAGRGGWRVIDLVVRVCGAEIALRYSTKPHMDFANMRTVLYAQKNYNSPRSGDSCDVVHRPTSIVRVSYASFRPHPYPLPEIGEGNLFVGELGRLCLPNSPLEKTTPFPTVWERGQGDTSTRTLRFDGLYAC